MRLKSALRRGVAAAVIAGIVVSSGIPAYAIQWNIADGDITVKGASDESGNYNNVKQGEKDFEKDEGETVITGESDKNTVTIDTSEGNVDVTFDDAVRYRQAIEAARPLTSDFRILGEYAECPNPVI